MYTPSKGIDSFHIAGFGHWDGALVANKMQIGDAITLQAEPDNPWDAQAVALYWNGTKIGYVPSRDNALLSKMFFFGHKDILTAFIVQKDLTQHPERQFRVMIALKDNRQTAQV